METSADYRGCHVGTRQDGLKTNRLRYLAAAKRYARQTGRRLFHGGIEPVWFFFLGLTRPERRKLGLRAENLRRWHRKALPLLGKHP